MEGGPHPTRELIAARVRSYEAACSTLLAMAMVGGFWAEEDHYYVWQRALDHLCSTALIGGLYFSQSEVKGLTSDCERIYGVRDGKHSER